jgi:hypothetical protein
MCVHEIPCASVYSSALQGLYSTRNVGNKGLMQYPLLPTRKPVVTLLDARRIDFRMSLVSLQGRNVQNVMSVLCMAEHQRTGKVP